MNTYSDSDIDSYYELDLGFSSKYQSEVIDDNI